MSGPPAGWDDDSEPAQVSSPPPYDIEAEAAVISACLLCADVSPERIGLASALVQPEDFYSEAHRQIFAAILALQLKGTPVDVVNVGTWLKDAGRIHQVGGMGYLTEVLNAAPAIRNVESYAETVRKKSVERKGIATLAAAAAESRIANGHSLILYARVAKEMAELAESGPRKVIPSLTGVDLAKPLPPQPYLVRGIGMVADGGAPHVVAGYAFSGKTVAMQSLLLSLATGRPVWRGFAVDRSYRVAHVDFEQGAALTTRRYQRLANGMGIDLRELGDTLRVYCHPPTRLFHDHRNWWAEIMADRDLIIIDSLRAATGGGDENDSSIREPLDMLGSISEQTKCRSTLVAHMGKPSENRKDLIHKLRGSSAIADATDAGWGFVVRKGEPVEAAQFKARSVGLYCEDWVLAIEDVSRGEDSRWGLDVRLHGVELLRDQRAAVKEAEDRQTRNRHVTVIRQALTDHPAGLAATQCRHLCKLDSGDFQRALLALGREVREEWVKNQKGPAMRWISLSPVREN